MGSKMDMDIFFNYFCIFFNGKNYLTLDNDINNKYIIKHF